MFKLIGIILARMSRKIGLINHSLTEQRLLRWACYAHMTTLRCEPVNPPLLGMTQVVSEDAVRRGFDKIEEQAGLDWLQRHLVTPRARF
jgi:hypothetical protein